MLREGPPHLKDRLVVPVAEPQVVEIYVVAGARNGQRGRPRRAPDGALLLHEREHGSHVDQRLLRLPVHRPQEVQRHGQLRSTKPVMHCCQKSSSIERRRNHSKAVFLEQKQALYKCMVSFLATDAAGRHVSLIHL